MAKEKAKVKAKEIATTAAALGIMRETAPNLTTKTQASPQNSLPCSTRVRAKVVKRAAKDFKADPSHVEKWDTRPKNAQAERKAKERPDTTHGGRAKARAKEAPITYRMKATVGQVMRPGTIAPMPGALAHRRKRPRPQARRPASSATSTIGA